MHKLTNLLSNLTYPLEIVRVKMGINGRHYHLLDCPMAQKESFAGHPEHYDYLEVEVPQSLVDAKLEIPFLIHNYYPCACVRKSHRGGSDGKPEDREG